MLLLGTVFLIGISFAGINASSSDVVPGKTEAPVLEETASGEVPSIAFSPLGRRHGWVLGFVFGTMGGLAIFLYGIALMAHGLQKSAGSRMKAILKTLTSSRLMGFLVGVLVTAVIQSSSATTVMLVGFVSAQLLSLSQTIAVILGAGIGTTITAQIIAFKITDFALPLIALGFVVKAFAKRTSSRNFGEAILGFGLLFFGMFIMAEAVSPLRSVDGFTRILSSLENPIIGLLVGTFFTAIVQSSMATLGILITLASQGLLSLNAGIPLIFGANIGTCVTAYLASLNASREAKRVAVAHAFFKIFGVALFIWWIPDFSKLVLWVSPGETASLAGTAAAAQVLPRQLANVHTIFNVVVTLFFLPLAPLVGRIIELLVPDLPDSARRGFQTRFLDKGLVKTPVLALAQSSREISRMAEQVQEMLRDIIHCFTKDDARLLAEIKKKDDAVDFLERQITHYLTQLSQEALSEEQSEQEVTLLFVVHELEHIGDVIETNLCELVKKKMDGTLEFSEEGKRELIEYHQKVYDNYQVATIAFLTDNRELAEKALGEKHEIIQLERKYRRSHIDRLHGNIKLSRESSEIHIDVIDSLRRIGSHSANIARAALGELWI